MRKTWSWIKGSRKHKIVAGIVSALAICAGSALAFYLLEGAGTGSGTQPLGSSSTQALSITPTFGSGLQPGQSEPITVMAQNPVAEAVQVNHLSFSISTPSNTSCDASWFSITGTPTFPVTLSGFANVDLTSGSTSLKFKDSGTDQTACEGVPLTVTATAS